MVADLISALRKAQRPRVQTTPPLVDQTQTDFPNPNIAPVSFEVSAKVRFGGDRRFCL